MLCSTTDDYLLSMLHLIRLILSRDQICRTCEIMLLLEINYDSFFCGSFATSSLYSRTVTESNRLNASRHCDVLSDASVGRTSYDEKIFLRYRSFIRMFFFPTNALTQRARSSARDLFWKDFISISKKNRHRDRRKFYVNERRRTYFGLSDRVWFIERRDPWHYQGRYMSSFVLQIFRRRIVL